MKVGYVLKLTDPEYSTYNFGYVTKGSVTCGGCRGYFLKEYVFETVDEAKQHIVTCLTSSQYRPDISEDNFEIVEVKEHLDIDPYFLYTDQEYERYSEYLIKDSSQPR